MIKESSRVTTTRQALSRLDRASKLARESIRIGRAAASSAMARKYRLEIPAGIAVVKGKQQSKSGLGLETGAARGGSGSGSECGLDQKEREARSKTASGASGWHRAAAMVKAGACVSSAPELSRAMGALSRTERSFDLGSAGRAFADSSRHATLAAASNNNGGNRARAGHETRRSLGDGEVRSKIRVAPAIRGVLPPAGVSRREFARPSSDARASNEGGGRSAITINSSPTVVVNAPTGGAVQDDVIGALRAHREELFDELKRESARRERAEF